MSRTVRYALAFLFISFWLISWHPMSDLATRVLSSLEQYMLQYPPEKVYILTDKPHYAVGENLWYKGWLVNGADHFPNSPSKLVYVELVAPDSLVVLRQTLRVVDGTLNGDFYLPHELSAGTYDLRAYTKWMRNFSPDYFFNREVTIGNLAIESGTPTNSENRILMRFFPEGGEWIEGLPAVLGVEASNSFGAPSLGLVVGIEDRSGKEIVRFNTGNMGLSKVELTPQKGVDYKAVILEAFDSRLIGQTFEVPKPLTNGFQMKIDATRDQEIGIRILNNIDATKLNSQEILIIGHVRGIVYYAAVGRADRNEFTAQVDRSRFPPGIVQFTLFTEAGTPVAERLIYNPDSSPLTVLMESNKESYSVRDLAEVKILVKDVDGDPVDGNIAISVTDASQVTWPANHLDVRNYLQLVSDLDGPVLHPGLYDQLSDSTLALADQLMLTRGWRRFDWQKVMSSDGPRLQYPLEQGLTIRGTVMNKQNKRAATSQNVILALLGDVKEFYDTETDELGQFKFENLLYPDSTEVLVQTLDTRKRRHYDIILETIINYDPRIRKPSESYNQSVNSQYLAYLNQSRVREQIDRSFGLSNDVRMLGEVTVTAAREALQPPERRSLIVAADRVIKAEEVGGYASNPLDMLRGRTAAFRVTGVGRDMTVTFNRGIAWGGDPVPLFILDGMEVDLMTLVSIPASNVESIELLTDVGSLAIYGSRGSNGVIAVNTKPGGAVFAAREGIINRAFAGYYTPREFYAPDYSEHLNIHDKPDSRSTVYWEPNLILNSNGVGIVRFWTSDDTGPRFQNQETKYRIHVEGITSTGKPIVGWTYLIVK
jgi:TonB-dependent SusC/RagA subfamily outer membrane receptor